MSVLKDFQGPENLEKKIRTGMSPVQVLTKNWSRQEQLPDQRHRKQIESGGAIG